jgi:hypothetical protein
MDLEKNTLEHLVKQLTTKASIKQLVYRNTLQVFKLMKEEGKRIITELELKIEGIDTSLQVEYKESGDFEFNLKFGGDMLILYMQSNIITFKEEYPVMQLPYIQQDPSRKYFGHITIYNFMADSIKYNRLEDPGYLIARLLVNREKHFFVEGSGQLDFLFQDIAQNEVTSDWLRLIIEKSMSEAMDKDLIGPKYPDIRSITLKQKQSQSLAAIRGEKIGFQLNTDSDIST